MENTNEINFDKIFKIMISAMMVNKCHPDIPRDAKWICNFIAAHGFFFSMFCLIIYSTICFEMRNGNLTQTCANAIVCVIFCVVSMHYWVMIRYQDLLKGLIQDMKTDYKKAKSFSLTEHQIVHNYAKRGKKVAYVWLIVGTTIASLFVVKSFFLMVYYAIQGEFQLVPLLELTYPSPIEEMKNDLLVFLIIYLSFLFYDGYALMMYIGTAALGPVFMLHACGQLRLVTRRLMGMFNDGDTEQTTLKQLNDIVKHLQDIYSFLDRIEKSLKILYELTLKATAITLPITVYQIMQSYKVGEFSVEFIAMIVGCTTLSIVPCYYGDEVMNMGENVRLAIYMCGWEHHLNKVEGYRRTLVVLQLRAARAMAIRTMFRMICLDALTDVFHQAYAIFNVLNAASL